jgi:hypothetical protein
MQYRHTMPRATGASIRGAIIALLIFVAAAATGFAEIKITNVEASTEKRPNATSGKDEVWVVLSYTITGLPDEGATLTMEATLANPSGDAFTLKPVDGETSGALGTIKNNGQKTIEWQAEKSLVRANKQGKYRCFVTLAVEGTSGVTRAVLHVSKYAASGWNYFNTGTAEITDLQRIPAGTTSCNPILGGDWQKTVEAGATFYRGEVTTIPAWRGRRQNDVITGKPSVSGCSAFFAIKGQGTPDEKIWVNFAKQMNMVLDADRNGVPDDSFVWEFQFRYASAKKDNSKSLIAGNAGKPDQVIWTEWNQGEDFNLELSADAAAKQKSNTFDLEVVRREFKYSYKGEHVMTFTALGDGYFATSDLIPNQLELKDGDMKINDWLHFSGQITIDTTVDAGVLRSTGAWPPPAGSALWVGPFNANLTKEIEGMIGVGAPLALNPKWNIGGFSLTFEKIRFVGGADKASGVQFDLRLLIKQLSSGCAFDIKKDPLLAPGSSVAGFKLNGVTMTDDKWSLTGVEAQNVGCTIAPAFCLKTFKANYDEAAKKVVAELIVKGPIFDEIGGGITLVNGDIDGFKMVMKLAGGGVPIPYPPPPFNVAEWRGFNVSVANALDGPFTLTGTLFFSLNNEWKKVPAYAVLLEALGKIPWIAIDDVKLAEFDGTGQYVFAQRFGGGFTQRLYSLKKDVWIVEGKDSITIQLNPSVFSLEEYGSYRVFNFGGNQWMFNGVGTAGITLLPSFKFGGSLSGEVLVPQLFKNNPVFAAINDWFKLPWTLGQVGVRMNDLNVSFSANIPRFGKADVVLDLTKDPFTEPTKFMWITNSGPVPATRLKDPRGRTILTAADTTWTAFAVTPEMERAFVQIWGTPAPPSSVLIDPQGRAYAGTASDSSVIFYASAEPGQSAMWAIDNPLPGTWKVGTTGGHAGDSIHTWARFQNRSSFVFNSTSEGRTIVARWTGQTISPNAKVDLFIDRNQEGYDGTFIGTIDASAGEFRYTMSDSLPECGYYIYAMRNDSSSIATAYSSTYHGNPKSWLAAPANIHAEATAAGNATITWDKSPDPGTLSYAIRVSDQTGHDSVYTSVNFNFTMATIHIENWQGKQISIQTIGENEIKGCWSAPVALTLAGVDEPVTGGARAQQAELVAAPQPANGRTTIHANVRSRSAVAIELYDNTGRMVMPIAHGVFEAGTIRAELDASSLPNGVYFVRITGSDLTGEGISASRKVVIQH